MSSGIWLLIGVLIGIVGPFGARFIYEWYMRPRIVIEGDVPLQGKKIVYHSIKIANKGRTVAKNCSALLTIKKMVKEDVNDDFPAFVKSDSYRPVEDEPLCWALQTFSAGGELVNPAFLSIYPNSRQLIDLCRVHVDSLNVEVPSEIGWSQPRVVLHANKVYEVELKIFPENVKYDPKKHMRKFELIPDEGNKDIVIKPLKGDK